MARATSLPAQRGFLDELPPGLEFRAEFITPEEEAELLRHAEALSFAPFQFRRRTERGFERFPLRAPPRPAYLLTMAIRDEWEHGIAPMDDALLDHVPQPAGVIPGPRQRAAEERMAVRPLRRRCSS
jgi:hypothetical protein